MLLLALVGYSCEKSVSEVSFRVKMEGFIMKEDPGFPGPEQVAFDHRYSAGRISFNGGQENHTFYIGDKQLDDVQFKLPVGKYTLESDIPGASLYGQATGSFQVKAEEVAITELTDTVTIRVSPNCSLILISDQEEELEEGPFIIEKHSYANGNFKSYPMARDSLSGLYYAYFTPDPDVSDPSAFLWFYGEEPGIEEGGIPTSGFEVGCRYYISILE
jgi:hypothetical protein